MPSRRQVSFRASNDISRQFRKGAEGERTHALELRQVVVLIVAMMLAIGFVVTILDATPAPPVRRAPLAKPARTPDKRAAKDAKLLVLVLMILVVKVVFQHVVGCALPAASVLCQEMMPARQIDGGDKKMKQSI